MEYFTYWAVSNKYENSFLTPLFYAFKCLYLQQYTFLFANIKWISESLKRGVLLPGPPYGSKTSGFKLTEIIWTY